MNDEEILKASVCQGMPPETWDNYFSIWKKKNPTQYYDRLQEMKLAREDVSSQYFNINEFQLVGTKWLEELKKQKEKAEAYSQKLENALSEIDAEIVGYGTHGIIHPNWPDHLKLSELMKRLLEEVHPKIEKALRAEGERVKEKAEGERTDQKKKGM